MHQHNSDEFTFRKCLRVIDKSRMSANRRAILREIVETWGRQGPDEGYINPGTMELAQRCQLSARTISRVLKDFRDVGFIRPIAYANGGWGTVRYTVDLDAVCQGLALSRKAVRP